MSESMTERVDTLARTVSRLKTRVVELEKFKAETKKLLVFMDENTTVELLKRYEQRAKEIHENTSAMATKMLVASEMRIFAKDRNLTGMLEVVMDEWDKRPCRWWNAHEDKPLTWWWAHFLKAMNENERIKAEQEKRSGEHILSNVTTLRVN